MTQLVAPAARPLRRWWPVPVLALALLVNAVVGILLGVGLAFAKRHDPAVRNVLLVLVLLVLVLLTFVRGSFGVDGSGSGGTP